MLRNIKYINHINETLGFGSSGIFIAESTLLDFAWTAVSKNNRIAGFKKGIVSKTVSFFLKSKTVQEGLTQKNRLFEVCEKDVMAVMPGKIIIGDYYLKCYLTESKKGDCILNNGFLKVNAKITTDFPNWIKESKTTFNYGSIGKEGKNLDFNRDFPSDYSSNLLGETLDNTGFVASNFVLNIYGACESPSITIAGHVYEVDVSIADNEYLTIDSINKTVILTHEDGTKENCFNKRNRNSYIFEKIPSGISNVASGSYFKFDVTLLEERSEPKWI